MQNRSHAGTFRAAWVACLQDTVGQLKKKYHALNKKYYPARQRLTLPAKEGQKSGEVLKDSSKLSDYGLANGSVVQFKDLGTQVWACRKSTAASSGPAWAGAHTAAEVSWAQLNNRQQIN
jgi:hypothetical protein